MGSAHISPIPTGCVRLRRSPRYFSSPYRSMTPYNALIAAQPPRNAVRRNYEIGSGIADEHEKSDAGAGNAAIPTLSIARESEKLRRSRT